MATEELAMRVREELVEGDQKLSKGFTEALIGETSKLRVKYDDAFKQVGKTIEEELKAMKQDIEDINNIKSKHLEVILEKLRSESEESIKLLKVQYREEMQNVERQVAKGIVDQEQKLNKDFSAMLAETT